MTPKRGDFALEVLKQPAAEPLQHVPPEEIPLPPEPAGDEVSLREYLDVVVQGRWIIAAAVGAALAVGVAYAVLASPVYRSDALVQVEDRKNGKGLLGDLGMMFNDASPAETEIEILRSRAILGQVVDELKLDVVAKPRRFPIVGSALARRHRGDAVAGAFFGFGRYGWGGERIAVDRLAVPAELLGLPLTLVAGEGGRYAVLGPQDEPLVEGEVGKAASGRGMDMFVSELRARPGLEFAIARRTRDAAVGDLQADLRISEKGKKTGILQIALDGGSAQRVAAILDSLSRAYVRQNVERKSAEAEKTLEFLETQLPILRANLDAAEAAMETYRAQKGGIDVTLETQAAVGRAVEIEKAASELEVEYAALRQKFTDSHPALVAIAQKIRRLGAERASVEARMKKLPASELESARRLRDVKVANELYLTVLDKAQELKVVKEGTIGNVRILDAAIVPVKPVSPQKLPTVALSLVLGGVLGVAGAFARRALDQGVEDPDAVERATGIGVHASVPHSSGHAETERRARREHKPLALLAAADPKDLAIESLRSLRTSLQFALFESRNAIVAIGGPAPGVGKSFVTANLAHLLGEAGRRVLVVDADLRRGRLHGYFATDRGRGLSDLIGGTASVDEAVRETGSQNVRFLPTGTIPPNPAELLGSDRFQRVLGDLATRYDVVLVDTPPVLAVTDGALIGRQAGVNLLVLRAGAHPVREIVAALRILARNGVRVQGLVMNDVRLDRGLGRRNAYHYQYKYE